MELNEVIEKAIISFISGNYGETPEEACYDISALAYAIKSAVKDYYREK